MNKVFYISFFIFIFSVATVFGAHKKKRVTNINNSETSLVNGYKKEKKYWEVKLSTNEIAQIKEKINSQSIIRGIHLTSWVSGNDKLRREIINKIKNSVINTVVVDVKEKNGEVYIPSEQSIKYKTYTAAVPEPEKIINEFKSIKLYTIARVVCFHDNILPKNNSNLAVKSSDGGLWSSRKGDTWVDPYNREVWDYILDVALRAAKAGFDEIQFDYVRYPTEGDTKKCRFAEIHNRENATKNISDFFSYARKKLSMYNVKISADVFGLTTGSDMGIGQDLEMIAGNVDRVYPMMYPSHYYSGEYNLSDPESQPYKIIDRGLKQAMNKTGPNYYKVIPYLQDFSLKVKYRPFDVRAQIIATKNNYINSFILWNPKSKYSWETLEPSVFCAFVEPEKCK